MRVPSSRRIDLVNETPWRTDDLISILRQVMEVSDEDSWPREIAIECGAQKESKPLGQRCSWLPMPRRYIDGVPMPADGSRVILQVPCQEFPVRSLARVISNALRTLDHYRLEKMDIQQKVATVRAVKAAGRLPLRRLRAYKHQPFAVREDVLILRRNPK